MVRIPSAEQEWAFVTPVPGLPAASAAQGGGAGRLLTLRTAQSILAEGSPKARKPMSLTKKKSQTESP